VADYAAPLPMMVIAEMLGVPIEDRPRFLGWTEVMLGLAQTVSGEDAERAGQAFAAATSEMRAYVGALVDARRTPPANDLLSGLVHATVDGERLTEDEILGFF